jgi:hypothetical protein
MVFVEATPSYNTHASGFVGDVMHVFGIPHMTLSLVSWTAQNGQPRLEVLPWNLPCEIIIVGIVGVY